ncbi:MAG: hypothetical protein IJ225_12180 [Solobacterium sp.]|nr:hypothetical protein [Solobacterium sp.]
MIETFEVINENDIQRFNSQIGAIGITIGYDLLGSPVLYVDHKILENVLSIRSKSKRRLITNEVNYPPLRI